MKTLNKPQIVLPLITIAVYVLFTFFSDRHYPILYTNVLSEYVKPLELYKTSFITAIIAVVFFYITKLYKNKIPGLQQQYYTFFEDNPFPMAMVCLDTNKFLATNKAATDVYGYSNQEFLSLHLADIRIQEELNLMYQDLQIINHGLKKTGIRPQKEKW